MITRLNLNRADIKVLQEKLEKFPDIDPFILEYNDSTSTRYTIDILIEAERDGTRGEFRIPVVK